jgi:hypothetical protein
MASRETADAPGLPQVKQCNTIGDWQYGSVAVAAGPNRWGVMTPDNGGHWATDADVKDWDVATSPTAKQPTPAPTPAPPAPPAPVPTP